MSFCNASALLRCTCIREVLDVSRHATCAAVLDEGKQWSLVVEAVLYVLSTVFMFVVRG